MPKNFTLSDKLIQYAIERDLNPDEQLTKLRRWSIQKDILRRSWDIQFRNWCDKAVEYREREEQAKLPAINVQAPWEPRMGEPVWLKLFGMSRDPEEWNRYIAREHTKAGKTIYPNAEGMREDAESWLIFQNGRTVRQEWNVREQNERLASGANGSNNVAVNRQPMLPFNSTKPSNPGGT